MARIGARSRVAATANAGTYSTAASLALDASPELGILPRLTRYLRGRQVAAVANPSQQRVTAWGAATVLRVLQIPASRRDTSVDLPQPGWPCKIAFVCAAPLIVLEVNMLRVVGGGVGLEWFDGYAIRGAINEWTGCGAMALGVIEVVSLRSLMLRRS